MNNDDLKKSIPEQVQPPFSQTQRRRNSYFRIKRVLDIFLASVSLLVLAIPLIPVLLSVFISDPGPVVFKQKRVGRNGELFSLYKIRTMRTYRNANGEEQGRITRFGRLLRRTSVDELLQLVNVLKGDMSLVGPRPLIPEEGEIHSQRMRSGVYTLRPGITGLAQIHGRDKLRAEEKLRWDVEYLHTISWKTDMQILCRTVSKVLRCEDIVEK